MVGEVAFSEAHWVFRLDKASRQQVPACANNAANGSQTLRCYHHEDDDELQLTFSGTASAVHSPVKDPEPTTRSFSLKLTKQFGSRNLTLTKSPGALSFLLART
jgi:hypothetical protein